MTNLLRKMFQKNEARSKSVLTEDSEGTSLQFQST